MIIDPKTGKVFDNIIEAWNYFKCPGPCSDCQLSHLNLCVEEKLINSPHIAAEAMGYKVIEENTVPESFSSPLVDIETFYKELIRMHNKYYSYGKVCNNCPLYENKIPCNLLNIDNGESHIKELVNAVIKWSNDNPCKTALQDFFEKYPKADKGSDGLPPFCPDLLGYKGSICSDVKCKDCWSQLI